MICIDWDKNDPYVIKGNFMHDEYARLDVVLSPCNYLHTMLDYEGDSISSECIEDLEQ